MTSRELLCDVVEVSSEVLYWLLKLVEEDAEPMIRHMILRFLVEKPPFDKNTPSPLATEQLVEQLWKLLK